jgi:hypothetical protein
MVKNFQSVKAGFVPRFESNNKINKDLAVLNSVLENSPLRCHFSN